jgi:hypothetical protein
MTKISFLSDKSKSVVWFVLWQKARFLLASSGASCTQLSFILFPPMMLQTKKNVLHQGLTDWKIKSIFAK